MREMFYREHDQLRRQIDVGGTVSTTAIKVETTEGSDFDIWDQAVLRGALPKPVDRSPKRCRIVDLFSGAGGLSLGVSQGLRAAGYEPTIELAADLDADALRVYERNIAPREAFHGDASEIVTKCIKTKGEKTFFERPPWIQDRRLASRLTGTDVLIGGPPCQGHSNLNNHTRRVDLRNELYLVMPALAVALNVPIVIIENVREVVADYHRVVDQTISLLSNSGYTIAQGVLSALNLGLPQTRNRFFLIAVKGPAVLPPVHLKSLPTIERPRRNLRWAIGDLEGQPFQGIHRTARLSEENLRRIDWLFENNKNDLPNHVRPDCHKNGHTYGAVYGRLKWEGVSGTITTGFLTPGRGRYVHPSERRTITPHEAARIQGFPDSFRFEYPDGELPNNSTLAKVVGDAVPPIMGQAAILAALHLRHLCEQKELNVAA